MALYGETKIKIEALQRWVDTLSADGIEDIEVGGENFELFVQSLFLVRAFA